jgi:hypothetical protein
MMRAQYHFWKSARGLVPHFMWGIFLMLPVGAEAGLN